MARNITEIQWKLIALGYMVGPTGADGRFGQNTLDAYNRFRASIGKAPVVQASMAELNADLFPDEQPAPPPKRNTVFGNLVVSLLLNQLKGRFPMLTFLSGYRTIVVGIGMVVVGALSLLNQVIPLGPIQGISFVSPGEAVTMIGAGFGFIFMRSAMNTATK